MSKSTGTVRRYRDDIGKRYNRLVVTGYIPGRTTPRSTPRFVCLCDCGRVKQVNAQQVVLGKVKSCGCYRVELGHQTIARVWATPPRRVPKPKPPGPGKGWSKTHGLSKAPGYQNWLAMMARCYNNSHVGYPRYGGRGITVCERWHSPKNFLADMGNPPSASHSLDRIDNDGNYEPGNCRWATASEQHRNRSDNHLLTWQGRTACIAEWVEITGLPFDRILRRLRDGWSVEKALSTPKLNRGPGSRPTAARGTASKTEPPAPNR